MSSIGEIKPDNNTAGIINVITDNIACCCVLQIDEIKSPTPTIESRDIKSDTNNNKIEPLKSKLQQLKA